MPIYPLPQFEADLEEDRLAYEKLKPPTSIVVRFGVMKMVGEFPYDGDAKPGCGSKMVVRTHRGTELAEMLTSTCPNAGCSKSVTRKEMLEYIDNSGGKDYPFFNQGKVLRVATTEDLNEQARIDAGKRDLLNFARMAAKELELAAKIVEAEPILGGERVTFYFASEERIDFRELVSRLAAHVRTRVEMRQIGARDEARLTADYEKCGQHCCCKQFLKVLKPVSMKSAKVQKATLDPLKISGRCGRLMCCLRYEDQTYTELQKRLPKRKWRVQTPDGDGIVLDGQILTQLVLVRLDRDGVEVAVPVEELTVLGPPLPPGAISPAPAVRSRDGRPGDVDGAPGGPAAREQRRHPQGAGPGTPPPQRDRRGRPASSSAPPPAPPGPPRQAPPDNRPPRDAASPTPQGSPNPPPPPGLPSAGAGDPPQPLPPSPHPRGEDGGSGGGRRRRRRKRRRPSDGGGSGPPAGGGGGT